MTIDHDDQLRVPVIEEQVAVTKVAVPTDRLRVRTVVDQREILIEDVLQRGSLDVERIAVNREVAEAPPPRREGDLLVISVVEERFVKRLFVVEEVRVRETVTSQPVSLPATVRTMRAVVEHDDLPTGATHD